MVAIGCKRIIRINLGEMSRRKGEDSIEENRASAGTARDSHFEVAERVTEVELSEVST